MFLRAIRQDEHVACNAIVAIVQPHCCNYKLAADQISHALKLEGMAVSGHPAGFIEAFANYYYDMADGLETFRKTGNFDTKWILSVNQAASGMRFLHQMAQVAI